LKLVFVFPGQGSQYVGMGKELYDCIPVVKKIFEEANDTLGYDVAKMCFQGPEEELKKTVNTQPAILTMSTACLLALKEQGIIPDAVAGHSLGEYSALVAAGSLEFAEALSLVRNRGKLMQECAPENSGMAAILGLDRELVVKACEETVGQGVVEVANYNCPGQVVIAGDKMALQAAMEKAKCFGAKRAIELQVSGPFHTSLMAGAGLKLAAELDKVKFRDPVCPVISNVTAEPVDKAGDIKEFLIKQVSSSVKWEDSIRRLSGLGAQVFIEVGPGKVLCGLGKKIIKESQYYNVEDIVTLQKTLDNLKEVI
jgi:[acyl-carrier-protein] S-malonyltransferase